MAHLSKYKNPNPEYSWQNSRWFKEYNIWCNKVGVTTFFCSCDLLLRQVMDNQKPSVKLYAECMTSMFVVILGAIAAGVTIGYLFTGVVDVFGFFGEIVNTLLDFIANGGKYIQTAFSEMMGVFKHLIAMYENVSEFLVEKLPNADPRLVQILGVSILIYGVIGVMTDAEEMWYFFKSSVGYKIWRFLDTPFREIKKYLKQNSFILLILFNIFSIPVEMVLFIMSSLIDIIVWVFNKILN